MKLPMKLFNFFGLITVSAAVLSVSANAASGSLADFNFNSSPFTSLPAPQDSTYSLDFAAGSNFDASNYSSGSEDLFARGTGATAMDSVAFSADVPGTISDGSGSYFDFTLAPESGQQVSIDSFSANVGIMRLTSGSTVPSFGITYSLRSSQDGFSGELASVNRYISEGTSYSTNETSLSISLTGNTEFQNISSLAGVTFRLYAILWTSEPNVNQLMRLDDVVISGSTSVIPEPSSFALGIGVFAVGLVATRRRRS